MLRGDSRYPPLSDMERSFATNCRAQAPNSLASPRRRNWIIQRPSAWCRTNHAGTRTEPTFGTRTGALTWREKIDWKPSTSIPLRELQLAGIAEIEGHVSQPAERVLFASAHSIVDFSNGAAVATLDVLQGLAAEGFACEAFCTSKLDFQREICVEDMIGDLHDPYQVRDSLCGPEQAQMLYTKRGRVPITVIRLESSRHTEHRPEDVQSVLGFFEKFLDTFVPDVMITYGGDPTTQGMIRLAKTHGVPVVFMIHNFGYSTPQSFLNVDHCVVASEFRARTIRTESALPARHCLTPLTGTAFALATTPRAS